MNEVNNDGALLQPTIYISDISQGWIVFHGGLSKEI